MKSFVRILAAVLVLTMCLAFVPVLADEGTVEISFCLGDDTIVINGTGVAVEKPYVVGDGVTLVPLRVITEAFGATVEWINETRTVNLTYPDVNIVLQIGNPVAEVNGQAAKLLSPPELTPAGFTMVPLRFISENFGAKVTYDSETGRITVVKENSQKGNTIQGAIDSEMIGDSYYGWCMKNPTNMIMDDRTFDGLYTSFSYDDENYIVVYVDLLTEDFDFDADFASEKSMVQGYTLVKADKKTTGDGQKYMHIQAKDKVEFLETRKIVNDKYIYTVYGYYQNENEEVKKECMDVVASFINFYDSAKAYDLSDVKAETRLFEVPEMGLSISVPANFGMVSSEDSENDFSFYEMTTDDNVSTLHIQIFSKSHIGTAKDLAQKDYESNRRVLNETITDFKDIVVEKQYKSFAAYQYSYDIVSEYYNLHTRDVFFELGEYVYNIAVTIDLTDYSETFADKILNSVEAKLIDSSEVGILLRNDYESEGTYQVTFGDAILDVPNSYEKVESGNTVYMQNIISAVGIACQISPSAKKVTYDSVKKDFEEIEKSYQKLTGYEVGARTKIKYIGDKKYISFQLVETNDDGKTYLEVYGYVKNGVLYVINVIYPEIAYSEANRLEVSNILGSLSFK